MLSLSILQAEGCKILQLALHVEGTLWSYTRNFVKADVVTAARDVTGILYKEVENQKQDEGMTVGVQAMRYLAALTEDDDPMIATRFYQ